MTKKKITNGTGSKSERITKIEILCELTPAEHTKASERLADLDLEINRTKEEARAKASSYRESIKLLVEERDPLAKVVDEHKESRLVECIEEANFDRNVIVTKRRDNGEHIAERAMESEERERMAQGGLPWEGLPEMPEKATNDIEGPRA